MRENYVQSFKDAEQGTPASLSPKHRRRHRRRSYFAIQATADEIRFPKHTQVGYLTKTRLIQRAQENDLESTRLVWEGNARLAYSAANRLRVRPQLVADLIQAAQLAMPRAIKGFDPDRLLEFSTYAHTAIWREMQRQVCRLRFFISLPPNLYPKYIAFRRELDRALTPSDWFDLRERLIDRGDYHLLRSVHALIAWEPLTSAIPLTTPRHCPTEPILTAEAIRQLQVALDEMNDRQRTVLERRYGLHDHREHTLDEIGRDLDLTKERVRQIQLDAEANLRAILVASGLDEPPPVPAAAHRLA